MDGVQVGLYTGTLLGIARLMALAALASWIVCSSRAWTAEPAVKREDQLKAAYLFNFVKFIEWPDSVPADILTMCFVGGEGVQGALAAGIENKRAGTRRLVARRLEATASATDC